jgi:PKD repeat protein
MWSTRQRRAATRHSQGRGGWSAAARAGRPLAACLVLAGTLVSELPALSAVGAATAEHHREIVSGASAVADSSFSLTVPAGVTTVAGRHLVVSYLFSDNTAQVTSIVDTRGNSYTVDVAVANAGSGGLRLAVASAKVTTPLSGGDRITVTQSTSTTYHAMQVYEFDNFAPQSWADRTATGNSPKASTSVATAPTTPTSQASETAVAVVGFGDTSGTLTSGNGFGDVGLATVERNSKRKTVALATKDLTSSEAVAYAGVLTPGMQSVSAVVTYRTEETPPPPPVPPTAGFTAAPTSGPAPLAVQFTDTSVGGPTQWLWDFGDGTTSVARDPAHTYAAVGTYTVSLTVANASGSNTATQTGLITVSSGATGFAGPATTGAGAAPTGEKPESKLWWNDGSWWGVLFDTVSRTHHIFRLDRASQRWIDTTTLVDSRPNTRADVLWDGQSLYVASHVFASSNTSAVAGQPARLSRYAYDSASRTYSLDTGFPVTISDFSSETLTIDKDSTGTLWASWAQANRVYVNRSAGSDAAWGTPFPLAVSGADTLQSDDIAAVVAFGGNRIGVMWSNQAASAMYFAEHADGDAAGTWQASRTAVQGPNTADDHINLKALQGDPQGHVFAAVKTSQEAASAPAILILSRDPTTGDWASAPFGRVSDCHTRPILVLDSQRQVLHVFATAPDSGCPFTGAAGSIFEKTSPMSNISFPLGRGTVVMRDPASPNINNATTTKQSVTDATGLIVLASDDVVKRYWHADVPL